MRTITSAETRHRVEGVLVRFRILDGDAWYSTNDQQKRKKSDVYKIEAHYYLAASKKNNLEECQYLTDSRGNNKWKYSNIESCEETKNTSLQATHKMKHAASIGAASIHTIMRAHNANQQTRRKNDNSDPSCVYQYPINS